MNVGVRVRVSISSRDRYTKAAVASLDLQLGTIVQVDDRAPPRQHLVRFDAEVTPWWGKQEPPKAWWFDAGDLIELALTMNAPTNVAARGTR